MPKVTEDPPQPPDDAYVRQRWVHSRLVDWAKSSDEILLRYGRVDGRDTYDNRHQARWRAQRLIRLMVDLRLHERWELKEHTWKRGTGWAWGVEYLGGNHHAST